MGDWKNWKKMRLNDEKIKELKQNIQRIKENQQALNKKLGQSINVNEMQMKSIYNLKNLQSAAIQKFDLTLNSNQKNNESLQESEESDDDLDNNNNNFFGQNIDLTQALKAVDSINIKEPKPNYVDLVKDKESEEEDDEYNDNDDDEDDDEDEDNDEWIVSIKKFLSDINRKIPHIDLDEIVERLDSLRYCSEFDVLNDVINDINNSDHVRQVKVCFVKHFGNLSQWSCNSLIKWCQCNNLYQICQKIRRNKIDGKQFINYGFGDFKQFFSNLTSIQIAALFRKLNGYFDDALSIL